MKMGRCEWCDSAWIAPRLWFIYGDCNDIATTRGFICGACQDVARGDAARQGVSLAFRFAL